MPEETKDAKPAPKPPEKRDYFQFTLTIVLALTGLLKVIVGWQAATASTRGANAAGVTATLNVEQTLTATTTQLYQHYRAYTVYARNAALLVGLESDPNFQRSETLGSQQVEAADLTSATRLFFPTRYLNRDGSYDTARDLGEAWAAAAQTQDLNPAKSFKKAEVRFIQGGWFRWAGLALGSSFIFFTLAESIHPDRRKLRYTAGLLGLLLCLITAGLTLYATFGF